MTQLLTPEVEAQLAPYERYRRQWGYCFLDERGELEGIPSGAGRGPRGYLSRKLELLAGSAMNPPKWAPKRGGIMFYHRATKHGQTVMLLLNKERTQFVELRGS